MTAQEIAEKIVTRFNEEGASLSNTDETYLGELVAAALEKYRDEGLEEVSCIVRFYEDPEDLIEAIRALKSGGMGR